MSRILKLFNKYLDGVRNVHPPNERLLFRFQSAEDLAKWETFSDAVFGGRTTASLTRVEGAVGAAFTGEMSLDFDESVTAGMATAQIRRSGFCGVRTKAELPEMDLEPFDTLAFRLKGDGRKYIASLRTDAWVDMPVRRSPAPTRALGANHDLWQTFIFAPPGAWADVHIPLSRFLKTWRGKVLDHHHEMRADKVLSVTISLAGGGTIEPPGPYLLELDRIWAVNARRLGLDLPLVTLVSEAQVAAGAASPAMQIAARTGELEARGGGESDAASAAGGVGGAEAEAGPVAAPEPPAERRPGDSAPRVGERRGGGSGGRAAGGRGFSTASGAAALPAAKRTRSCSPAAAAEPLARSGVAAPAITLLRRTH